MSRQTPQRFPWLFLGAILALIAGAMVGCGGTPRERYQVLSKFFDGVPDPDAPQKLATTVPNEDDPSQAKVVTAVVMVQHKPYKDRQCDACHRAGGEMQDFEKAYDACIRCHKKVPTEHPRMHGPVARAACRFCHTPHESSQPHLLKDTPVKVCTQCHDRQLLSDFPAQHTDGQTSCLNCHFGHGGAAANFLKPDAWNPPRPTIDSTTGPAVWPPPSTAPASPPATRPAPPPLNLQAREDTGGSP